MRDKFLLAKLVFTFLLLSLVIFSFKPVLDIYTYYSLFGILGGFYFSWFMRERSSHLSRYLVNAGAIVILAWMIHALLNSTLFYSEIILICIKGAVFFEVIMSFNAADRRYLAYSQAISLPLFMYCPLITGGYNESLLISTLGFILCWLAILRLEFYEAFNKPLSEISFEHNNSFSLLIIISLISLVLSGVVFFKFPLKKVVKSSYLESINAQARETQLEKEFDDSQTKIINNINNLISEQDFIDDKYAILGLLDPLIKESSTIMEVEKAELGLKSYLKSPGPGIEKGEGEETTVILKEYVDKKSEINIKAAEDAIMQNLKKDLLNIKDRASIAGLANKIQNSSSNQQVLEYAKKLEEAVEGSSFNNQIKKELTVLLNKLKEWKIFSLNHIGIFFAEEKSQPLKEEEPKPAPAEEKQPKKLKVHPQKAGVSFNIMQSASLFNSIFFTMLPFAGTIILILFFVLYFLTKKEKMKLIALSKDSPRELIINLYDNLKALLVIFDAASEEQLFPLLYAELIEKKYAVTDNSFLKFSVKFEEAKYSRHALQPADAVSVLQDYNHFLKILFQNYNKLSLIFRYFVTLLYRKPIFI